MAAPSKAVLDRAQFAEVIERIAPANNVSHEAGRVGGAPG